MLAPVLKQNMHLGKTRLKLNLKYQNQTKIVKADALEN